MPKVKQNKLPRRRPAKSARAIRSSNPGPLTSFADHESMIVGLTDPFSAEAANARYPDTGAGRTLTFQQRFTVSFNTDASGTYVFAITPKANYSLLQMASATGNVVTWPATYSGNSNASTNLLNTYGLSYRPTSFGVRISNTLSATNSAGYIVIAKGGPPVLSSTTTFNPSNFTSWDVHPMRQGGEWHATGHPRSSGAYALRYVSATSSNTADADATWDTIYIGVFGSAASTAAVLVEWVVNYEYNAQEDAPIAQLSQPQPTFNVGVQAAVNAVQTQLTGAHSGTRAAVKATLKREARKAFLKHVVPFVERKGLSLLV